MKKFLAIVLVATMLLAMLMPVNAAEISTLNVLDFGTANNSWLFDENTDGYGIQGNFKNLAYSMSDDGEIMTVTVKDMPTTDYDARFVVDVLSDWDRTPFKAGAEADGKAEYMKIRIKNESACQTFGMQWAGIGASDKLDMQAGNIVHFPIDAWTDGFVEYTFSVREYNALTNYNDSLTVDPNTGIPNSRWNTTIAKIAISPFGLYLTDGSGPYNGASMQIDYVVFGSKEYCENYKSELQKEEDKVSSIEIVNSATESVFVEGDTVDTTGMTIKATFEDGTTKVIESGWKVDVNPDVEGNQNVFAEPGTTNVKVIYGKASVEYMVLVKDIGDIANDVEVSSFPKQLNYQKNEKLNEEGMTLTITTTDGSQYTRTRGWTVRYDFSTYGQKGVTVLWNGEKLKATMGGFYVIEPDYIVVTKAPTKTEYKQGDTIDLTGMELTLYYKAGQGQTVTSEATYTVQTAYRFYIENPVLVEVGEEIDVVFFLDRNEEEEEEGTMGVVTVKVVENPNFQTTEPGDNETTATEPGDNETTTDNSDNQTTTLPQNDGTTTQNNQTTNNNDDNGGNATLIIIIVVAVVAVGGGVAAFFIIKKKK